eukprot:PITA_21003
MNNNTSHIKNERGARIETHEGIENEFLRHLKQVHQEPKIDRTHAIDRVLRNIPKLITEEHNLLLLHPTNLQEVENVVRQLKAGKAPGPDGFTSNFFHNFWDVIKMEVWQVVEESCTLRWMYPGLNSTFIALIPKEEESSTSDKWFFSPLSSSFFSVLINGIPSPTFPPSRGIRQGDPLSPFIFFIMAQRLGRSIKSTLHSQRLKGLSFLNSPTYSHQQFVDDNMLFGHPSVQEARLLKALLSDFFEASGANINRIKSQILFFNTVVPTQNAIAYILGFNIASLPSKYLGAPLMALALKHSSWKILLEKLEVRLLLWTHRALNMASRLVLIKAVLHSMPLYLFSILAASKWVLKEIKKIQRNFLWGKSGPNRKWALVKWDKVCLSKKVGGIGLRDPRHNNAVMGAKIW